MTHQNTTTTEIRPWDIIVRITHWGIALAVLLNGLITEEGETLHIWVGYIALSLLVLRLLWGIVGTKEARFSSFSPSLGAAKTHISEIFSGKYSEHRSHNPLGALMVYALWGTLAVVIATGIAMTGSPLDSLNPQQHIEAEHHADEKEHEEEEVLEEIHELAANLLLILAALHVAGVAFETKRAGNRNLIRRMITVGGRRNS